MNSAIQFVGDLILGDQPVLYGFGFNSIWGKHQYQGIFEGVKGTLHKAEYNVANFEAIIKNESNPHKSVSEWSMCCEEYVCRVLAQNKINIVSVANNHTMDYGREWFDYTVYTLQENGIAVIGLKECPYIKIKFNNKKIAIIACSYLKIHNKKDIGYLSNPTQSDWATLVEECSDCDIKIAYVHWGSEFIAKPSEKQYKLAKEIVNTGIDVIIGHHPHILQTKELVDGKLVVFSMGNFMSDYWQKRLRKTEILSLCDDGKIRAIDCTINNNGVPKITGNSFKDIVLERGDGKYSVALNRFRMRIEYFCKIVANFYKIKEKKKFIIWLLKRVKYVVFFSWRELNNPEIIYEYYEN